MAVQQCDWEGCHAQSAYRTRTKPAWCDKHITEVLRQGGIEPLEPFTSPTAWRLTRCLRCGCEAHYRFVYTLEKNPLGEPTCRACFWREWAATSGAPANSTDPGIDEMRAFAEEHGYEYLGPLTSPPLGEDPHRVRCRYCGRISAQRPGDIGWGCSCQVNPSRPRKTARVLFRDSGCVAVRWWNHERNPTELWATATNHARRSAWWNCPDCGAAFQARIADMVERPSCPTCQERERSVRVVQQQRREALPVSSYPELLSAWADPTDPASVILGDRSPRLFRCVNGHQSHSSPETYLNGGCPTCQGQATRAANAKEREAAFAAGRSVTGLTMNPELVEQWHPTRNAELRPVDLGPHSRRSVWWREQVADTNGRHPPPSGNAANVCAALNAEQSSTPLPGTTRTSPQNGPQTIR